MRCYVLMGVSGCGKSSIGTALAVTCGMHFVDGDALHPTKNINKMSRGEPLDDQDRAPWLADVGRILANTYGPIVIGCSALKKTYRDWIRAHVPEPVRFIHLFAPRNILAHRIAQRTGHFMPPALLASQYATLEPLETGELGANIDISKSYSAVVTRAEAYVQETLI